MKNKSITTKQMGDAAEMLVAAHLTLNGIPSIMAPPNWPEYDVIAVPKRKPPQKISVKCRGTSSIGFRANKFDWLAIVLINKNSYDIYIIPKNKAKKQSTINKKGLCILTISKVKNNFKIYLENFKLDESPQSKKLQKRK